MNQRKSVVVYILGLFGGMILLGKGFHLYGSILVVFSMLIIGLRLYNRYKQNGRLF